MKQNPVVNNSPELQDSIYETKRRLAQRPFPDFISLRQHVSVSFEFFPPTSIELENKLWSCVTQLAPLRPRFVSVTYGAGGSTRQRTHATVEKILAETLLIPAAHVTCVGAPRDEVDEVVRRYWDIGVRHLVALRGDSAGPGRPFISHPQGYQTAAQLVAGIRKIADFEVTVAAYPEIHPDAESQEADLDNLKRKLDAGANRAITQYFFNADDFLRFLDRVRAAGISAPIIPGILPVTNFARVVKFSEKCGATIPVWMRDLFAGLDDAPDIRQLIAATVAIEQCRLLLEQGINEFHFYTLNRAELTQAICHALGLREHPEHSLCELNAPGE
jgi:methylenetetrahydrofolate reductase (NADPH)